MKTKIIKLIKLADIIAWLTILNIIVWIAPINTVLTKMNPAVITIVKAEEVIKIINVSELPVREQIAYIAGREHFSAKKLIALAECESSMNPKAVGDNGDSLGLYQINRKYHNLSDADRMDIEKSTLWTIEQLKAGRDKLWTCLK